MRLPIALGVTMLLVAPAIAQEAGTTTALEINPQSYTGVWYEIARTPTPYQQDCEGGVTAAYNLIDDATMEVINRCDRASVDEQGIIGEAEVVDGNFNTFSVEFGDDTKTPGINYVVAAVGDEEGGQYPWAAVYSPDGDTGWILAREPELAEEDRQKAEASLSEAGVDLSELSNTAQPPQTYDPLAE
ncbi:lipocalin family protein [Pelagibacterium sp. H642]|uniref:lipocalin family protein n=1 Tax=Pelagibacterium sp. H642 TaxID=1881069 RepID=UPI002815CF8F|nr:lipocalin family protein [Pelagibacterium sp. H642]WMT92919.1 lipocalin family protein [Pelagibacterium sp. H642]